VDRITASWPGLLLSPIETEAQRDAIVAGMNAVQAPAPRHWTLARVAALLSGYYAADVPTGIIEIEAEDWAEALDKYPAWAITKAVRWWKGESNPNRRKRPLEGDIAARARLEMGPVFVAAAAVSRFERGGKFHVISQTPAPKLSPDAANEILATAGFKPRRMTE